MGLVEMNLKQLCSQRHLGRPPRSIIMKHEKCGGAVPGWVQGCTPGAEDRIPAPAL